MSKTDKNRDENMNSEWFVRINEGDIYGPVDLLTLQQWSEQGRIEPENEISEDQENWISAEELPDLAMDWTTELEDESIFGPFNIQLAPELLKKGVLSTDSILKNRKTGEVHSMSPVDEEPNSPLSEINWQESLEQSEPKIDDMQQEEAPVQTEETDSIEKRSPFSDPRLTDQNDSNRLEETLVSNSSAEVRSANSNAEISSANANTIAEIRKKLTKERAKSTVLQDNILRLQDDLKSAQTKTEASNNQLFEEQARLAESQAEVENINAQLNQLQEHYDRLQEESQNQFEAIDQLRAESMEIEQEYQHKVTSEADRATSKTAILAQTLRLIYQDKDLKIGNIPKKLLGDPNNDKTKELQLQVCHLQEQVEDERKHTRQIDNLLKSSKNNQPKNLIVIMLVAIVFVLTIILALAIRQPKTAGNQTAEPPSKNTLTTTNPIQEPNVPNPAPKKARTTKRTTSARSTLPAPTNLDLPPENNSTPTIKPSATTVNWPTIKLPRTKINYNNNSCRIVFTYGIFTKHTIMTPEAKLDLAKLAKQLCGKLKDFTLIIEGHTDSTPVSNPIGNNTDNYAIGMARAEAAKKYLEIKCNVPKNIIRTVSAGETDPPYPNDTPESRRKNRTVILTLIPPPK